MQKHITKSLVVSTLCIILLFVVAEFFAYNYSSEIKEIVQQYDNSGKIFFVLMAAFAVIVPLWSNIFLLPFGVVAWGSFNTAALCIFGWWIGSIISFSISRGYREWLITKYPSLNKNSFVDSLISKKYKNLSLIFLRMTLPVDILSYALGLFSHRITWKDNAITTFIGITPFAFIFSYITIFSPNIQLGILVFTVIIFMLYIFTQRKEK